MCRDITSPDRRSTKLSVAALSFLVENFQFLQRQYLKNRSNSMANQTQFLHQVQTSIPNELLFRIGLWKLRVERYPKPKLSEF